jgi:putative methyltransferase (TIGR04325 family)
MTVATKAVARSLCPPLLWQLGHSMKSRFHATAEAAPQGPFVGPFDSWQQAVERSDGWDADVITARSLASALAVRDGLVEWEQDTIACDKILYSPAILAMLVLAAARDGGRLDVIDFGGNLATNYYQNRKILGALGGKDVRWHIVERPVFVELGRRHFAHGELAFHPSVDDALAAVGRIPDAFLFSGSLQCLAEPIALLDRVAAAAPPVLAFDRLLVAPDDTHRIYVQRPDPKYYYPATYPSWCFAKAPFIAHLGAAGYALVEDFTQTPDRPFDHCGMLFIRR